jgi:multiple sugar transport system permease protein
VIETRNFARNGYKVAMILPRRPSSNSLLITATALVALICYALKAEDNSGKIVLRATGVHENAGSDPPRMADMQVVAQFEKKFPNVVPVSTTGLEIPGKTMDVVPLMQIAGDIPQDVMYVNLRQSATYIANKFLYPLDKYVEKTMGVEIPDGHLLSNEEYVARLKKGANFERETADRVTPQCWEIMRRKCPYGAACPYCKDWKAKPAEDHSHIWFFPNTPEVNTLFYRKDLLYEAGLPKDSPGSRGPKTMEEMLDWCKQFTNPKEDHYGMQMYLDELGWSTLGFLYSEGGRLVEQDEKGKWRCCFDSDAAVEAYYFVARLFHEPFDNKYGHFTGVVFTGDEAPATMPIAMKFDYLSSTEFTRNDSTLWAFGPLPAGKSGVSGGEFNASMLGVYAGIDNELKRNAAWEFIHFYNCPEARLIRTRVYVENGLAQYVHPQSLREAGYPEFVAQIPQGWEEAYRETVERGVPEPYGENTQQVYRYASKAIDQIRTDARIIEAIQKGDETTAKNLIREILHDRVRYANEKMLNILAPEERSFRNNVAMVVAIVILIVFSLVFWNVFTTFAQKGVTEASGWKSKQHRWAYIWLLPALGSIALWEYYPLGRGTVMAFQTYNVRGFSDWVGLGNFASVLFDQEFWYAIWVSLKYALFSMLFGFCAPIVLAFLLSEVPKGKTFFRTIYYLPAVLSGVVVMFLWKSFYAPEGLLNQFLNVFVHLFNSIPGIHFHEQHSAWLSDKNYALLCCILPSVWAGMGPGCLIYLAALKTIPEELYEAADIDGAGVIKKIFYVALPSIKALIFINFVGAVIGVMKSGGQNILVMTGGGPYTPNGQSEVVGLKIWWEAFAYLRFGPATAMAWILGSMLIGFTVIQLKRLRNMEFKTAERE